MQSDTRYLGFGLVIGILIAAAAIAVIFVLLPHAATPQAAVIHTPPAAASLTPNLPTATTTPSPIPTNTFIPTTAVPANFPAGIDLTSTPTVDPILSAVNSGALVFSGPLSNAEQVAIYRASIAYVKETVREAKAESKAINGVGYGDPTNICGPLAIAILRDAGVISPDIVPYDFWLLNPVLVLDQRKIEQAFPADQFTHVKFTTPLNKVDWTSAPLEPGDFVFIWHGSWGNFDHMLVVNRVDSAGRAYAVTNFGTAEGYVIQETMLYDPQDPNAGIFHTWTQARDQILGSTGFGGYEVWRARGQ